MAKKYCGVKTPFLAISIMPLLMSEPMMMPKAAMIVTTLYEADFVPTAADMKLVASLLTPAMMPKIAKMKMKVMTIGKKVSIDLHIKLQAQR